MVDTQENIFALDLMYGDSMVRPAKFGTPTKKIGILIETKYLDEVEGKDLSILFNDLLRDYIQKGDPIKWREDRNADIERKQKQLWQLKKEKMIAKGTWKPGLEKL